MRESLGPRMITFHQCHHPEIVVADDHATGRWYLDDRVQPMDDIDSYRLTIGNAYG